MPRPKKQMKHIMGLACAKKKSSAAQMLSLTPNLMSMPTSFFESASDDGTFILTDCTIYRDQTNNSDKESVYDFEDASEPGQFIELDFCDSVQTKQLVWKSHADKSLRVCYSGRSARTERRKRKLLEQGAVVPKGCQKIDAFFHRKSPDQVASSSDDVILIEQEEEWKCGFKISQIEVCFHVNIIVLI
jgi:hypothetical protein